VRHLYGITLRVFAQLYQRRSSTTVAEGVCRKLTTLFARVNGVSRFALRIETPDVTLLGHGQAVAVDAAALTRTVVAALLRRQWKLNDRLRHVVHKVVRPCGSTCSSRVNVFKMSECSIANEAAAQTFYQTSN
jgi:hypothetical protein